LNRRNFSSLLSSSLLGLASLDSIKTNNFNAKKYKISLAQWSINGSISRGKISPIDFATKARELEIDAIEHVNTLYSVNSDYLSKNSMKTLVKDLNKRANDNGVKNLLIMISQEGELASSRKNLRAMAIDKHKAWIDVANEIGCESVRVDLRGSNSFDKWKENSIMSLNTLCEYSPNLNITVENHGGFSSNGKYLADVMKSITQDNCGTLPDFGNFCINGSPNPANLNACKKWYDRYEGINDLMPFAKALSAKSYDFLDNGDERYIDYYKMMRIVNNHPYEGYIGIEYEGNRLSEDEGILATKKLLEKIINS
jgi:sugar phosphate isomerase/epimerase